MRTRWVFLFTVALIGGAIGGMLLAPAPADAVAKELIELQRDVSQILSLQRDLTRSVDEKHAVLKTLVEQALDSTSKLQTAMGAVQKTVQDSQANAGTRLDTMATQVQGLADNLDAVQSRLGKINQQMIDLQNTLQSLDAKVTAGAPPVPPGGGTAPGTAGSPGPPPAVPPTVPPPSADVLYSNAYRDFTGGKLDLARQEFSDYLKYYPDAELASNAQFWLGEIAYSQKQYPEAIAAYDRVLDNYPKSGKLAASRLKKGMSLIELGQKASGVRELREVVRRFPGSEEERKARARLRELGVSAVTSPR